MLRDDKCVPGSTQKLSESADGFLWLSIHLTRCLTGCHLYQNVKEPCHLERINLLHMASSPCMTYWWASSGRCLCSLCAPLTSPSHSARPQANRQEIWSTILSGSYFMPFPHFQPAAGTKPLRRPLHYYCGILVALLWDVSLPLRERLLRNKHSRSNQCRDHQVWSVYRHQGEPVVERQCCSCDVRKTWHHSRGSGHSIDDGWGSDPRSSQCIRIGTCIDLCLNTSKALLLLRVPLQHETSRNLAE